MLKKFYRCLGYFYRDIGMVEDYSAISKESSTETGFSGLSAGVPYFTWSFPSLLRYILSILPR
jgi:hypothetical protein